MNNSTDLIQLNLPWTLILCWLNALNTKPSATCFHRLLSIHHNYFSFNKRFVLFWSHSNSCFLILIAQFVLARCCVFCQFIIISFDLSSYKIYLLHKYLFFALYVCCCSCYLKIIYMQYKINLKSIVNGKVGEWISNKLYN